VRVDVSSAIDRTGTVSLAITGDRRLAMRLAGRRVAGRAPALILHRARAAPEPSPTQSPSPGTTPTLPPTATIPLSDADAAAHVIRSPFEPRPANTAANQRVPTAAELQSYRSQAPDWTRCSGYPDHVTGAFTGTTDEILQWAAWKWGLDADLLRAVAAIESWWNQGFVGDGGQSQGLMQIQASSFPGTAPLSGQATAFNVDVYGATIRSYYDGCATWLNTVTDGRQYAVGDLWGSVGAWYAGRWHTDAAELYIARVMQAEANRVWMSPEF
jgi:hypothetical protein